MVTFMSRPGGQQQFFAPEHEEANNPTTPDAKMQEIINFIRTKPNANLKLASLAATFHMTERTLTRQFKAFTGKSVAEYVTIARVSFARTRLEDSFETLEAVASNSGFGSLDSMRRAFDRELSVTPSDYRSRFRSAFD